MQRITEHQLTQVVHMIHDELRWQNLLKGNERLILDLGSKKMGRAFRLYTTGHNDETGWSDRVLHLGDGYLGQTKREAYLSLIGLLRAFESVRHGR